MTFFLSEILRASGKNGLMQNQGLSDYDRVQFGSVKTSFMPSLDTTQNFTGWNSLSHEVSLLIMFYTSM
jgi:protein quaking